MDLNNLFNQCRFDQYAAYLKSTNISDASIQRKLSSLASFQKFLIKKNYISPINDKNYCVLPLKKKIFPLTPVIDKFKSNFLFRYIVIFSLFAIGTGLGFTLYRQAFLQSQKNLAYSTASNMVTAGRFLSFQGRLTDSSGNPIVSSTNIIFKLFNNGNIGSGTTLYTSQTGNSQIVVPDDNGIFSVTIGKSHGTTIPSSVFTENAEVWLEITAGGETMSPRQQIATVGYALNAETLQGLPPSASGLKNTVLVIGESGNLVLGETSPSIISTSGTLGIEGQAVLIKATDGSGGNITINPDANGTIKLITEGTGVSDGFINATNANLTSGNLINASINNTNRGYNFINFSNYNTGTTLLSSRFSVDAFGNTRIGGTLTIPQGASNGYVLTSDASGNSYWAANIGVTYTAGNGLNLSGNQFKLGGTITENTRLNIGNTEAIYISSNGNVGIGVTNPAAKFNVIGKTLIGGTTNLPNYTNLTVNQSTSQIGIGIRRTSSSSFSYFEAFNESAVSVFRLNESAMLLIGAGMDVGIGRNSSGVLEVNNGTANAYRDLQLRSLNPGNVNLGIGTTAPTKKLDVVGDIKLTGSLFVGSAGTTGASGQVLTSNGSGSLSWTTPSGSTYTSGNGITLAGTQFKLGGAITENTRLNVGNTEVIYIDYATGNVGLGTTNPTAKLNIFGTTSDDFGIKVQNTNQNAYVNNIFENNLGSHAYVGIGGSNLDTAYSDRAYLEAYSSGLSFISNTDIRFYNGGTLDGDETLRVTNSGLIVGGNADIFNNLTVGGTFVSVGSTNLVTNLNADLLDGYHASNFLTASSLSTYVNAASNGLTKIGKNVMLGGTLTQVTNIGTSSFSLSFLGLNDTQSLFIDNTGFIGLGTTAPTKKLDVVGDIKLTGSLFVGSAGTTGASGQVLTSNGSGSLSWTTPSGSTYTSGNGITLAGTQFKLGGAITENTRLNVGNTEVIYISANGKIGIGTTNPNYPLQVNGNALFGSSSLTYIPAAPLNMVNSAAGTMKTQLNLVNTGGLSGAGSAIDFYTYDVSGGSTPGLRIAGIDNNYSADFAIYTKTPGGATGSLNERFRITNTGNIGINNNNPTKKLDVVGDIKLTGSLFVGAAGTTGANGQVLASNGSGSLTWITPAGTTYTAGTGLTLSSSNVFSLDLASANTWTGLQTFNNIAVGTTNLVTNLNADLLDGYNASSFLYTAGNGITLAGTQFKLGGEITENTRLNIGNTEAFYINYATGNVGLGTTAPTKKLDVVGDIKLTGSLFVGAAGTTGISGQVLTSDGVGSMYWATVSTGGTTYTAGNGLSLVGTQFKLGGLLTENTNIGFSGYSLSFSDAGSTLVTFSSTNNVFYNPTSFTSGGDVSMAYDLNFTNSISSNINTASPLSINAGESFNSSNLTLKTYNAGKIILDSSAVNVGGTLNISQGASNGYILTSDASGNSYWAPNSGVGSTYTAGTGLTLSSSNVFSLDLASANTWTGLQTFNNIAVGTTGLVTNLNADLLDGYHASNFLTGLTSGVGITITGAGSSRNVAFDYGASLLATGNKIGINFANTNTWTGLQTFNNINVGGTVSTTNLIVGSNNLVSNLNADLLDGYNSSSFLYTAGNGITLAGQQFKLGGALTENTNLTVGGNSAFFINSTTGNIGLGTTSPTKKLDVVGDIKVTGSLFVGAAGTTGASGQVLTSNGSGSLSWTTPSGSTYTSGNGITLAGTQFKLGGAITENTRLNVGNTEVIYISANGNIGVGTTSPKVKFDIGGNINSSPIGFTPIAMISDNSNTISGVEMSNRNTGNSADFRFLISDSTSHYFTFAQPGINNSSTLLGLNRKNTDYIFNNGGTARDIAIGTVTAGSLVFSTANTENMRILQGGNVGINNTNPTKKLDVVGDIKLTGSLFVGAAGTTGSNGQVLASNGSGSLTWITPSGSTYTAGNGLSLAGNQFSLNLGSTNVWTALQTFNNGINVNGDITATGTIRNVTVGVNCATPIATVAKTATVPNYTLTTGDLLSVTFTDGNSVASATLNINGSGAKNIRLGNSDVNTTDFTISAGSVVLMYYDGTYFQIMGSQRTSDTDTFTSMYWGNTITAGSTIYDYKVLMQADDGKWYPLTNDEGLSTTKVVSTQEFTVNSPILYYAGTTNIAANGTLINTYSEIMGTNFPYTFNQANFTNQLPIYLKGTINSSGHFVLDNTSFTSFMTQTLPTTEDGFVYILFGQANSTTAARLFQYHPMYEYQNGRVQVYDPNSNVFVKKTGGEITQNFRLTVGGTDVFYLSSLTGNIGLGTTAPTKKLDVVGDIKLTGSLFVGAAGTTGSNGQVLASNGAGSLTWITPSGSTYTAGNGITLSGTQFKLGGTITENTNLKVGNTSAFFINATTGNIGLGTTAPNAKLNVIGNASFSGNVGIGTTNPGAKLDVQGGRLFIYGKTTDSADYFGTRRTTPADAESVIELASSDYQNASNPLIYSSNEQQTSALILDDGSGPTMKLINGFIGLGTTAPTKKLDVVGDIKLTGSLFVGAAGTTGSNGQVLASNGAGSLTWITPSGSTYTAGNGITLAGTQFKIGGTITENTNLKVGNTSAFFINATTGNIGLGTTNATSLLTLKNNSVNETTTLGSELLTASNWTLGAGWSGSFASGFTHIVGSTAPLTNTLASVAGNYYQISYIVTGATNGSFNVNFGGQNGWDSETGYFSPKTTSTASLSIIPNSAFNGKIILSIKQITAASKAIFALYDSTGVSSFEIRNSLASLNNTFIGQNSGAYNTSGFSNTSVGTSALSLNSSGYYNSAFGDGSLASNTTGYYNSAFGKNSLTLNTDGTYNNAFGVGSLENNTTGYYNNAFGNSSLNQNTSGNGNSAFGIWSLYSNTTGQDNNAFGNESLVQNTIGERNNAFGNYALNSNNGYDNNAFGYGALLTNIDGSNNNAFGTGALLNNINGSNNNAFGLSALATNNGSYNTAFGDDALFNNSAGSNNTAFGYEAGRNLSIGSSNIFLGSGVGGSGSYSNRLYIGNGATPAIFGNLSTNNIGLGTTNPTKKLDVVGDIKLTGSLFVGSAGVTGSNGQVLASNGAGSLTWITPSGSTYTAGNGITLAGTQFKLGGTITENTNLKIGNTSAFFINATTGNIGLGTSAPTARLTVLGDGSSATSDFTLLNANGSVNLEIRTGLTDLSNIFIGNGAGFSNTTGEDNNAFGDGSLYNNTTGQYNSAFGYLSLYNNTTGQYNSAFGTDALANNHTGSNNNAFGTDALIMNHTGSNNSAFGTGALSYTTGSDNTAIGYNAGHNLTIGSSNIFLGSGVGDSGSYSNRLYIGNGATPAIFGNLSTNNIGLGTTNPTKKLDVVGDIKLTGSLFVGALGVTGSSGQVLTSDGIGGLTWSTVSNGGGSYGMMESDWVNTGSTLPAALYYSQTTVIGDYVYLFGGLNSSSVATNVIYRAPVSNPTAWVNTGSTIPGTLAGSQTTVIGDYVYLFGGITSSSTVTNVIYRAPISNPTAWVNTGSVLPAALYFSQTTIIGDYVYLFGGHTGSSYTNVIYRAPVSNPTAWVNTGSVIPGNLAASQAIVIGDYVYLFGGYNTSAATNVIYRAPVSNPTAWVNTGSVIPGTNFACQVFVIGSYIYIVGGHTGSTVTNIIYRAPVSNPTAWVNTGSVIPTSVYASQLAIINDNVYLFGGAGNSSYISNNIYRAPIFNGSPDLSGNLPWKYKSSVGSSGSSSGTTYTASNGLNLSGTTFKLGGAITENTNLTVGGTLALFINATTGNIGLGTTASTARLIVLGDGSSATSDFTLLNADGSVNLEIRTGLTDKKNTFVGKDVGSSITLGIRNSAFGFSALDSITFGYDNNAFGEGALSGITTGGNNSGFGSRTLSGNNSGSGNSAFGNQALVSNQFGSDNSAFGFDALFNSAGSNNTAFGYEAGRNLSIGSSNIFLGSGVGGSGSYSNRLYIGNGATPAIFGDLATNNIGLGTTNPTKKLDVVGDIKLTGSLFVGSAGVTGSSGQVLASNGAGSLTWITPSGSTYTAGNGITLSGTQFKLGGTITENTNLKVGNTSAFFINASNGNIGLGTSAPTARLTVLGDSSSATSDFTLLNANGSVNLEIRTGLTDLVNIFVGKNVGSSNTVGYNNSAFGDNSLSSNTSGTSNSALGYSSLKKNDGGEGNSAFGSLSLYNSSIGSFNSAFGITTLFNNTGSSNTAIGGYALAYGTALESNIAIGYGAGSNLSIGSSNIFLGNDNGGYGTYSNRLYIGNGTMPAIFGDLATNNIGLGTTNPGYKLTVIGASTSGVALIKNLTSTTAPTLTIGTSNTATGTTGAEFVSFTNNTGAKIGRIRMGNNTSAVAYALSGTADLAEYVSGDEPTETTDLIAYHGNKFGKARPGEKIAGTYSNYGSFVGNENIAEEQYSILLALRGIVDVKVSSDHGNIKAGDALAISNIAGVAAKATTAGYIVGQAMTDYSNSNTSAVGTIKIMVNPGYYDPDINLTATGQINVNYNISDEVLASLGYNGTKNEIESASYSVTDSFGNTVTKINNFAQIASAKIKTGFLSATNIVTKNLVAEKIVSPKANIDHLISLDIQTTSVVAQEITTNKLTANEATVSTLYADNIISKEGSFGDLMTAKVSALRDELQKLVSDNIQSSEASAEETAITGTSILSQSSNWSMDIASDSAKITGDLALTNNLIVGAKLFVQGDTQLGNAFISGTFTAGEIAIKDNFIETTNTALYIQPSSTGSVHIMGETLVIAENGNVEITGNLTVSGSLMAKLITADEIQTNKLTASEITSNEIKIVTDSASTIIAESGFGAIATSSAQLTSNATAGTATLPAGKTEIIISNNKISANSMVYLTPVGSTKNQVPYIKSKNISNVETPDLASLPENQNNFTIAIDQSLDNDVVINWWIIN